MRAPAAVKVAFTQLTALNEINAVGTAFEFVPTVGEGLIVSVIPPVVYPVPELDTSFVAEYTVVDAPSVAADVYKAILKVSGEVGPKLCICCNNSSLKLVVAVCVIAILGNPNKRCFRVVSRQLNRKRLTQHCLVNTKV